MQIFEKIQYMDSSNYSIKEEGIFKIFIAWI